MRPIKFRAWNTKTQKCLMNAQAMYDGNAEDDIDINGNEIDPYENGLSHTSFGTLLNDERGIFVIEQFTGLLDKNGKEIYEGDVVLEVIDSGPDEVKRYDEYKGIVVYERNGFGIQTDGMPDGEAEVPVWGMDDGYVEIEVLGNIHENPELLR